MGSDEGEDRGTVNRVRGRAGLLDSGTQMGVGEESEGLVPHAALGRVEWLRGSEKREERRGREVLRCAWP